jgi:hypothetical protein
MWNTHVAAILGPVAINLTVVEELREGTLRQFVVLGFARDTCNFRSQ